jgi:glycerophosphoryl diester phosphodiesterase
MSKVNTEIRLLLNLWGLGNGQGLVKKSELLRPYKGKEKKAVYEVSLNDLADSGAIALTMDKKVPKLSLTDAGSQQLANGLLSSDFGFEGQLVGSRLANAALRWFRQNQGVGVNAEAIAPKISTYDEFKAVALETYDQLNRDYNFDNLVPIYRIRRAIGERVTRSQFNEWLIKMQADNIFLLQESGVEDSARDKLEDSVSTPISGLRCYATKKAK